MITESDLEFVHTVWNRRPFFTYIFLGINVVIFVLMSFAGGTTNDATLLSFGAKANYLIDQGEYWRFVTPIFIHIGLLHIFFNSYALWMVGPQVEKLYGGARFVLLYIVTGIAGVAGSYWYRPDGLSAGASGAIFGLFGVLLVFGIRHRDNIPAFFKRSVGTGVLPVIIVNLIIGFSIPQIDNSAHIAGLLSGMALAAVIPFERPREQTPRAFTTIQFALLALVVLSFVQVARHYASPVSTGRFIDALNHSQNSFVEAAKALDEERKPDIHASIAEVGKSIDELKSIPSLSSKSDALTSDLLSVMQDEYELLQDVDHSGTITLSSSRRASENSRKFRNTIDAINSWVDAEGEQHGIQLQKPR